MEAAESWKDRGEVFSLLSWKPSSAVSWSELLTSGLLMTFVSWGLKGLVARHPEMIIMQAFVLKKQENKLPSSWRGKWANLGVGWMEASPTMGGAPVRFPCWSL